MIGMLDWCTVMELFFDNGLAPALPAAPTGDWLLDGTPTVSVEGMVSVDPVEVEVVEVWVVELLLLEEQEALGLGRTVISPLHASLSSASKRESCITDPGVMVVLEVVEVPLWSPRSARG